MLIASIRLQQKTTLPYEANYLDLDPTVKYPLGNPVIRITADYQDNEKRVARFAQEKMEAWYKTAGAVTVRKGNVDGPMAIGAHAYGGTRMGDNAETNVADRWGFSHEVPNLGVMGASLMGTSGSPTTSPCGSQRRTAQHLVDSWKGRTGWAAQGSGCPLRRQRLITAKILQLELHPPSQFLRVELRITR
jgi:gluconate 2-dehydrogenase alpha chain